MDVSVFCVIFNDFCSVLWVLHVLWGVFFGTHCINIAVRLELSGRHCPFVLPFVVSVTKLVKVKGKKVGPTWIYIHTGWSKKTGPACFIANILKTPRSNWVKVGELLQYCMPNAVITFLFKSFVALWRHLAKNVAIVWCSNLFVQC